MISYKGTCGNPIMRELFAVSFQSKPIYPLLKLSPNDRLKGNIIDEKFV